MANDDRNVELKIDVAGDAAEKLRALVEALDQAKIHFDRLDDAAGQLKDPKFLSGIQAAKGQLDSIVNRRVTAATVDVLDPDRAVRGEDPVERRRQNAAMRNQETTRRREASVRTQDELQRTQDELQEFADVRGDVGGWIKEVESETARQSRLYNAARRNQETTRRREADQARREARDAAAQVEADRLEEQNQAKSGFGSYIRDEARSQRDHDRQVKDIRRESQQRARSQYKGLRDAGLGGGGVGGKPPKPPQKGRGFFSMGGRGGGGRRFGRYGGGFIALYAVSRAAEGAAKSLADLSDRASHSAVAFVTAGQAVSAMVGGAVTHLPIIGGVFSSIAEMSNLVGGTHQAEYQGQVQAQNARFGFSVNDARQRQMLGVETTVRQRQADVATAGISAAGSAAFANYLQQPGVAQSFTQSYDATAAPFTTSAGLDTSRLAVAREQFEADAAGNVTAQRRREQDQASGRVRSAEANVATSRQAAGRARNVREGAEADFYSYSPWDWRATFMGAGLGADAVFDAGLAGAGAVFSVPGGVVNALSANNRGEYVSPKARSRLALNSAQAAEQGAAGNLASTQQGLEAEREAQSRAVLETEKAITQENEKQNRVKQAQAEVDRQRLEMLKQERAAASSREQAFGDMNPSERLNAVFAIRQVTESGYQTLSPEQRAIFHRLHPEIAARYAAREGRQNPESALEREAADRLEFQGAEGQGVRGTREIDPIINGIPARGNQPAIPGLAAQATIQVAVNEAEAQKVLTEALQNSLKGLEARLVQIVQEQVNVIVSKDNRQKTIQQGVRR